MTAPAIRCAACHTRLPEEFFNRPELTPCPSCKADVRVWTFPAFGRSVPVGALAENVVTPDEAGCFYHPEKRAATTCESCGRFLCSVCDCEIARRHLCPACIDAGRTKGQIRQLENRRMRWDSIALALAIIPVLFFYATLVTAPAGIYLVIRYWNDPTQILPLSRVRFTIAFLLCAAQLLGWLTLAITIIAAIARH
jgi:hypothetical protein